MSGLAIEALQIAVIGFGEAGRSFARAAGWGELKQFGARVWDVRPAARNAAADCGVGAAETAAAALTGATLVLSLVTADQALAAAKAYAPLLGASAVWCDMNSVSPQTKRAAAAVVEGAGAAYVDVGVLAPVLPAGLAVPLLLSGGRAEQAGAMLGAAGFTNVRVVGTAVGRASAIKMIRSVMVKGIEALTAEMILAAEAAGVTQEVLASLDASEKPMRWQQRAPYNLERMATHGLRRAAEMDESAATLQGLGVVPLLAANTAQRQREMAGRHDLVAALEKDAR